MSYLFTALLIAGSVFAGSPQDASDRYYEAIRNNDFPALRRLLRTEDVNARDNREATPLMYAAAFGSPEAMRMLIEAGADVNAKNTFDATALLWCAHDLTKVRLLTAHGAKVNVQSKQGRTPLIVAAMANDGFEVAKLLVAEGADVKARDSQQTTPLIAAGFSNATATTRLLLAKGADVNERNAAGYTPLILAAAHGNVEMVRELIARGAKVNAVTEPSVDMPVKNGAIALGLFTPLLAAAPYGGAATVKALIDAGADVNARDVRGMTPLMLATATDRQDPAVIGILLKAGADPSIKSKAGETAMDWARKSQNPRMLAALGMSPSVRATVEAVADRKAPVRAVAIEKSVAMLQRTSGSFFKEGGCASCHSQNITAMAVAAVRANGFAVNEVAATEDQKGVRLGWSSFSEMLLQRFDPPGTTDTVGYALLHMSAGGGTDRTTDAMVFDLAGMQMKAGNWHFGGIARPPVEDGDFSRTALAIRALRTFGPAGRKAEFDERIARAARWLAQAEPRTTEDRNMRILGLVWAGYDPALVENALADVKAAQRADGGWSQTADLDSDAYATGVTLYALHEAGLPGSDSIYRRGVQYLLRTQNDDGSWYVKSRAPKFQPYFQSGFPYDHDQWISAMATAWATMGLAWGADEKPLTQAAR